MVEAFSGSEKKAEDSLTYYKEIPEPQEKLSNKDLENFGPRKDMKRLYSVGFSRSPILYVIRVDQ